MHAIRQNQVMSKIIALPLNTRLLRGFTWALHVAVSLLAILSLFSWRFDLWMDLRWAGPIFEKAIPWLWVASVLMVPIFGGPLLQGLSHPQWAQRPQAPAVVRLMLWPTYLMILLLLGNTAYFYTLWHQDRTDASPYFPATLLVAGLLGVWAIAVRRWLQVSSRLRETVHITRFTQLAAFVYAAALAAFLMGIVVLYSAENPPKSPVDVAVVLGNRVLPNGDASVILRDRTLAAIDLYKRGLARHLLLSGAVTPVAGQAPADEPEAMRRLCEQKGIPDSALTLDPIGINTRATAANTRQFMIDHGYTTVVACSSPSHLTRVRMAFREVGISCTTVASRPQEWTPLDPREALREIVGIVVYAVHPNYHRAKAVEMNLTAPRIVVHKAAGKLELFDGPALVKTYACITGSNSGDKSVEGDRKTPLGNYRVVFRNPDSKYYLSLGLDYPNRPVADKALAAGLINREQYDQILAALDSDLTVEENQNKLWKTPLGGEIFIHGHAEGRNGTAGCVALSNPDIEELYAIIPLNTLVEIRE